MAFRQKRSEKPEYAITQIHTKIPYHGKYDMIDMKDFGYTKKITTARFLSPFENFTAKELVIEERFDEITGVASRILPFRMRPGQKADIHRYLEKSPESLCPFCPQLFEKSTPRFGPEITLEGKFKRGTACIFPNAFPYDQSSAVAIFSSDHFIPIEQLTPGIMRDGFAVCIDYFQRIDRLQNGGKFCSINWNYMPPAGGGLIHPHLQTIVGPQPTRFMIRLVTAARNYTPGKGGGNLWQEQIRFEQEAGERFIADTGSICWLAPFSPKGMAGEIDFIFKGVSSIFDITESSLDELMAGLSKVFNYLSDNNYISFNLAIYAAMYGEDGLWVQGKIVPRFEINLLGTSDLNYFEKLHDEIICLIQPEHLCRELRPYFSL